MWLSFYVRLVVISLAYMLAFLCFSLVSHKILFSTGGKHNLIGLEGVNATINLTRSRLPFFDLLSNFPFLFFFSLDCGEKRDSERWRARSEGAEHKKTELDDELVWMFETARRVEEWGQWCLWGEGVSEQFRKMIMKCENGDFFGLFRLEV